MRKPKRGLGTLSPRRGQRPLHPFSQIIWDCYRFKDDRFKDDRFKDDRFKDDRFKQRLLNGTV
jgi:hypothetical protein